MQFPTPQSCIFLCLWQSGLTPIHVAAFMGHENIVTQLTNHGASANTMNVVSTAVLNPTSTKQTVLLGSFLLIGGEKKSKTKHFSNEASRVPLWNVSSLATLVWSPVS